LYCDVVPLAVESVHDGFVQTPFAGTVVVVADTVVVVGAVVVVAGTVVVVVVVGAVVVVVVACALIDAGHETIRSDG
jgi:hypothetical protein